MSSVTRFTKQTPSTYFWSHGADIWYYNTIVNVFNGTTGSYSGPAPTYIGNVILFDTDQHLYEATNQLFNVIGNDSYLDGYNTAKDLGKRLYIGVNGSTSTESQMFTLSLAGGRDNDYEDRVQFGYGITAMNLSQTVHDLYTDNGGLPEINLFRGGV
jgi:hypothetical protein